MAQYNWPPSGGSGGVVIVDNFPNPVDVDYGTPTANTIRTAAMLGIGSTAVDASNPVPVDVVSSVALEVFATDFDIRDLSSATDSVSAVQSGTWTVSVTGLNTLATEATLAALSAKFGSLGQKAMAGSAPVVIASDQSAVPVTATDLDIRDLSSATDSVSAVQSGTWTVSLTGIAGLATEATLSALNAKFSSLGQKAMVASAPVVLASDQSAIPVSQSGTWNVGVTSSVLPTGAATETTLAALSAKFNSLGQKTMANSAPVVIASDQTSIPVSNLPTTVAVNNGAANASTIRVAVASDSQVYPNGLVLAGSARNDYSSSPVNTGSWSVLVASLAGAAKGMTLFDSSGETLELGVGPIGLEVRVAIIPPGGHDGYIPLRFAASDRVVIRALSATASVGEIDINFFG